MERPEVDAIVDAYLADLEHQMRKLPAAQRIGMLADVRQHIEEARADELFVDEATIRRILDEVASPRTIAAEAGEMESPRHRRPALVGGGAVAVLALFTAGFGVRAFTTSPGTTRVAISSWRPTGFHSLGVTPTDLPVTYVTVPDLVGLSPSAASDVIATIGLRLLMQMPSGLGSHPTVSVQYPNAGTKAMRGSTVTLGINTAILGGLPPGSSVVTRTQTSTPTTVVGRATQSVGSRTGVVNQSPPSTTTTYPTS